MRAQYHSRPGPDGRRIWDVRRLVALAADLPVRDVPLAEIDELYWFDAADATAPTVRAVADHARLIAEADLRYPILLCAEGRVMDGMHRVAKATIEGRATIAAVRFPVTLTPNHIGADLDARPYDD